VNFNVFMPDLARLTLQFGPALVWAVYILVLLIACIRPCQFQLSSHEHLAHPPNHFHAQL